MNVFNIPLSLHYVGNLNFCFPVMYFSFKIITCLVYDITVDCCGKVHHVTSIIFNNSRIMRMGPRKLLVSTLSTVTIKRGTNKGNNRRC